MTLTVDLYNMMNCGKYHWNPCDEYIDVVSREIGVNGRTDSGRTTENKMAPPLIVGGSMKKRLLQPGLNI